MKRVCRIVIALVGLSGLTVGQDKVTPAFTLRLPRDINPQTVRIDVDVRGKSHWWTLRVTPAMEAGATNHVWNLEELAMLLEAKNMETKDAKQGSYGKTLA
jgi:hypothetical protein